MHKRCFNVAAGGDSRVARPSARIQFNFLIARFAAARPSEPRVCAKSIELRDAHLLACALFMLCGCGDRCYVDLISGRHMMCLRAHLKQLKLNADWHTRWARSWSARARPPIAHAQNGAAFA